jgi:hypothetical protein
MDVRAIVKQYMENNGYTALCNDECGCSLDDFMPCDCDCIADCEVGYANHCPTCAKHKTSECPNDFWDDIKVCCSEIVCYQPKESSGSEG